MKKFFILPAEPLGTPLTPPHIGTGSELIARAGAKKTSGSKDSFMFCNVFLYRDELTGDFKVHGKEPQIFLSELLKSDVYPIYYGEQSINFGGVELDKKYYQLVRTALLKSGFKEGKKLHSVCSICYEPGSNGISWEEMNTIATIYPFHVGSIE